MEDFLEGICNGSLIEVFATGTVAIINPIRNIYFDGKIRLIGGTTSDFNTSLSHRFFKSLTNIYYGRVNHQWAIDIENWGKAAKEEASQNIRNKIYQKIS